MHAQRRGSTYLSSSLFSSSLDAPDYYGERLAFSADGDTLVWRRCKLSTTLAPFENPPGFRKFVNPDEQQRTAFSTKKLVVFENFWFFCSTFC